jgi:hypothetical protein
MTACLSYQHDSEIEAAFKPLTGHQESTSEKYKYLYKIKDTQVLAYV